MWAGAAGGHEEQPEIKTGLACSAGGGAAAAGRERRGQEVVILRGLWWAGAALASSCFFHWWRQRRRRPSPRRTLLSVPWAFATSMTPSVCNPTNNWRGCPPGPGRGWRGRGAQGPRLGRLGALGSGRLSDLACSSLHDDRRGRCWRSCGFRFVRESSPSVHSTPCQPLPMLQGLALPLCLIQRAAWSLGR